MDVNQLDLQAKLQIVITRAASLLPSDIGQYLLALITPQALATMATIVMVWAGAHFFGVGELADVILLITGWAAIGGVAIEAGKKLYDFAFKTYSDNQNPILMKQQKILLRQLPSLVLIQYSRCSCAKNQMIFLKIITGDTKFHL